MQVRCEENLHEFSPVRKVFVHVLGLAQSGAALGGLVLDAGPADFQLLQSLSDTGFGPRLSSAQSSALLSAPAQLLGDQLQVSLKETSTTRQLVSGSR